MVTGLVAETEDTLLVVKGDTESKALILISLALKAVVCELYGRLCTAEDYALALNCKRKISAGKLCAIK